MLDAPFSRFIVFIFYLQQISKSFTNWHCWTIQKPYNRKQSKLFKLPRNGNRRIRWKSMHQRWATFITYLLHAVNTRKNTCQTISINDSILPSKYLRIHIWFLFFLVFLFRNAQQAKESILNSAHLPLTQALINLKEQQELAENQVIFINGFSFECTQKEAKKY